MITVALHKELGCKDFVPTVEVTYSRRCSSETNKLRYVHTIGGTSRHIAVEKRDINYIKIKIVPFIKILVQTIPLYIDKFKSKNGVSI